MSLKEEIQTAYPDVEWEKLNEAMRAARWELICGPQEADYWVTAEPLEHYKWKGWEKAISDIEEMLEEIPYEIYTDEDDTIIGDSEPEWGEYHVTYARNIVVPNVLQEYIN